MKPLNTVPFASSFVDKSLWCDIVIVLKKKS